MATNKGIISIRTDEVNAYVMEDFRNIHSGCRCAILCNGCSISRFPTTVYPYDTIGINRSWMVDKHSRYHFALSIGQLTALAEKPWETKCLVVGVARDQNKDRLIEKVKAERTIVMAGWTQNDSVTRGIGFALDLVNERPWMPNTPYLALQFVRWAGYKYIDIWGLDLEGTKFWDKTWTMNEGPAKQQDDFFNYAAGILEADGVRVINRNPDSKCTAFERQAW
jgi:hypothetical protein